MGAEQGAFDDGSGNAVRRQTAVHPAIAEMLRKEVAEKEK